MVFFFDDLAFALAKVEWAKRIKERSWMSLMRNDFIVSSRKALDIFK